MEVAIEFIEAGHPKNRVLRLCGLAKSSFYYRPKTGKQGRKPYAKFLDKNGIEISGETVINAIVKLFENKFVDYGYYKVYIYLRDELGFKVSKHSVYNLMKNSGLLQSKYASSSKKGKRNWVSELIPQTVIPFDYWEFDIKFVWIAGKKKNMQVLTVIDVNSRWNLGQLIAYSIKKEDVIKLFKAIFAKYPLPKSITVRSDNGSQFIADDVQSYFKDQTGITQEFTKPATPQQDAHIESYHSIMESAVCQRFEFKDLKDARKTLDEFREFYNFERIHGGIGFTSPYKYLLQKGIDMKPIPI
jgi:putative transposase